jgi:DNA-binding response OmpR family regulator
MSSRPFQALPPAGSPKDSVTPSANPNRRAILLVEDDSQTRTLIQRMLEGTGYELITVPDGDTAFQFFLHSKDPIAIMMLDVMIPGINGIDLMRLVQARWPTTNIILVSGQLGGLDIAQVGMAEGTIFLQKPFTQEQLLEALRKAEP